METILILHGWGSCAKNWARVKELLSGRGYDVFSPDLPGFGENPPPVAVWNIDNYVEWVKDFLEKNNLSQVCLAGHSFGGAVATKFSVKYPEKVKKLILVDISGIREKEAKKEIQKTAAHFLNKFSFLPFYGFFRKVVYRVLFRKSDYLLTKGVMRDTYLKVLGEDISNVFSGVSSPAMLIWGGKDNITPLRHAYFIKEQIAGAQLEIIPNVGHSPHRETPDILVEKIVNFIKS